MDKVKIRLVGESPILMNSDRGANPLDPQVKEKKKLTSVKKKTDEIHEAIAKAEWMLSLYHHAKIGPYIPTTNVRSAIAEGGTLNKLGAAVKRGTMILSDKAPLVYTGPRDPEELWGATVFADVRSVVMGNKRVMRYRPVFSDWSLEVEVLFDGEVITRDQLLQCADNAGRLIGLGDFRPNKSGTFGRFTTEVLS